MLEVSLDGGKLTSGEIVEVGYEHCNPREMSGMAARSRVCLWVCLWIGIVMGDAAVPS